LLRWPHGQPGGSTEKPRILGERGTTCQTREMLFARSEKKSATPRGCAESTPKEEGGGDNGGNALETTHVPRYVSLGAVSQIHWCNAIVCCAAQVTTSTKMSTQSNEKILVFKLQPRNSTTAMLLRDTPHAPSPAPACIQLRPNHQKDYQRWNALYAGMME